MKISFENLGAIKKAEIDLSKKLTLLVGPNGTGKTYLSYAVYGYMDILFMADIYSYEELRKEKEIQVELDLDALYTLKGRYFAWASEHINALFGIKNNNYFDSYKTKSLLTKEKFCQQVIGLEIDSVYTSNLNAIYYSKQSGSKTLTVKMREPFSMNDDIQDFDIRSNATIGKYLCNQSLLKAYILPVERNSVYTFADSLAAKKIEQDGVIKEEDKLQTYPKPIRDALATAVELKNIKKQTSEYTWLADSIEDKILNGKVSISDDGELLFTPKYSEKVNLPVHLSASIVKNLSGLLVYLRHQAKKNDLLIIDEPELGLHPDNQVRLARIFARIINAGLRLMVSTHSDYIIQELNNLIMLSSEKPSVKTIARELEYGDDEKINEADVSVYLFHPDPENPQVVKVEEPLKIEDNGFEVKTIDDEICKMNNHRDKIFYALRYDDGE